jgi:hypothetical protein
LTIILLLAIALLASDLLVLAYQRRTWRRLRALQAQLEEATTQMLGLAVAQNASLDEQIELSKATVEFERAAAKLRETRGEPLQ